MDTLLRKYQWAGRLLVIGAAVSLLAVIANHIIASQLAPLTVPKLPGYQQKQKKGVERQRTNPDRWDQMLVSRCPFGCSGEEEEPKTCPNGCPEGKECQDGVCVPTEESQKPTSDVPVESDLNVKLMGCMVADRSEYSLAMVQDGGSQQTYVVSKGDFLPGEAKVVRIERDRIFVQRNGQLEFIRLERTIGGDPSPVSINALPNSVRGATNNVANPAARKNLAAAAAEKPSGGGSLVRESEGNKYVLSKEKVHEKLKNPKELAREARVVPNYKEGKRRGIKLVGVSPSGLYSELGFETGDVLHSVAGRDVNKQTDARRLIKGLKEKDTISVVVERDGKKMEKSFHLE